MKIRVSLVEQAEYVYNFELEDLAEQLGLSRDSEVEVVLAAFREADLDPMADGILNHFDGVIDRDWAAEVSS